MARNTGAGGLNLIVPNSLNTNWTNTYDVSHLCYCEIRMKSR